MPGSAPPVLDGVRVVEFSQLIAAPFCGLTLLDLGAEVIKVESRSGDPLRKFPPYLDDGESAQFRALNRGKRSVVADLATPGGSALARKLIKSADVVIENLGNSRALLGIGYEDAAARRPELVWCAISGWGADAPGRAIDPSLQAAMGLISITGENGTCEASSAAVRGWSRSGVFVSRKSAGTTPSVRDGSGSIWSGRSRASAWTDTRASFTTETSRKGNLSSGSVLSE